MDLTQGHAVFDKGIFRLDLHYIFPCIGLLLVNCILVGILSSASASANDSVVDEINVTVPVACSLTGTGMNSHNATILNGNYNSNIGTTTFHAFCNDNEGFAIYAIGYTDDTYGKNVLTNSTLGDTYDIETGTAISGADSTWAMKLSATSGTYTPIIAGSTLDSLKQQGDPDFTAFQEVPDEYTKVAYRTSSTDTGENATGSILTSTYQTYISPTQAAGDYTGQVKYVLVHPSTTVPPVGDEQIGVLFDGNGLFFDQAETKETNRVVYEVLYEDEYGYVKNTPSIMRTTNIGGNGVQNGSYYDEAFCEDGYCEYSDYEEFEGASKVKLVVQYGLGEDSYLSVCGEGECFESRSDNENEEYSDRSGTKTLVFEGDYVNLYFEAWGEPNPNYNYGVSVEIYPVYDEPTEGASYGIVKEKASCSIVIISGAYIETTTWNNRWYMEVDGEAIWFSDGDDVVAYLVENVDDLVGSTIVLYSCNPYRIYYDGNGATAGTMNGFYTSVDSVYSEANLMAPNFKKDNYGFAGWSANPNATVNGNGKIYGPNETIAGNELVLDDDNETTLYAVWVPSSGTMQSFSCSSLTSGQVIALSDSRDNNVYTVGKMQDGNCWMMENLRLDAAYSTDETKAQGFGWVFTGLANSEDVFGGTNTNSRYNITSQYIMPRYNNNNTNIGGTNSLNTTLVVSPGTWNSGYTDDHFEEGNNNHVQWYSYGNYYSWAAAMANTDGLNTTAYSESANTSICPNGWVLPYGNDIGNGIMSGGFSYLDIQMGGTGEIQRNGEDLDTGGFVDTVGSDASNRWRKYPNNFVYSGYWGTSSTYDRGWGGYYWSRTSGANQAAYYLYFNNYMLRPEVYSSFNKKSGHPIRCLTGLSN